ncbi:MAG: efflux RND transporter periplasmic adaptor subunit [Chromatiales bacterium]|nr:MAG: efflux RND transporter periplasmic adaptor subunit [Chromatiales bacterium]
MTNNKLRAIRYSFLCGLLGLVLAACGPSEPPAPPPLPVQVVEAEQRDVPLTLDMVGTTLGTQDVPIRARVDGFLEGVFFKEGRTVNRGDLLYRIDQQPFKAKLVEAQSELAAAQTRMAQARSDLGRIKPLAEMKAVSEQDLDSAQANYDASRASVRAAESAVELAEIELSYTEIRAPISGLIGLSKAKPGEYVGKEPNPVVLNVLSDIDPIRVRFSISEREYLILARTMMANEVASAREMGEDPRSPDREDEDTPLQLILADGTVFDQVGRADATAQAIDPQTGTFTVEASFPNPDGLLLPGQFARVRADYTTLEDATVIPRRAITELQGRYRVMVVGADNTVEVREVQLGPIKDNDQVVESGLEPGERVIVEGLQKVRPGMVVAPTVAKQSMTRAPLQET